MYSVIPSASHSFIQSVLYFSDHKLPQTHLQELIIFQQFIYLFVYLVIHSVLYFSDHSPQQTHIPELIQDQARNLPFSCSLPKVTKSIITDSDLIGSEFVGPSDPHLSNFSDLKSRDSNLATVKISIRSGIHTEYVDPQRRILLQFHIFF